MNQLTYFDVLIVYAQSLATSASDTSPKNLTPFPLGSRNESYNIVYGYFMQMCRKFGLNVAFTTSADIIGPGSCRSFWTYTSSKWHKVNSPCFSALIFDKFSPVTKGITSRRQLLFSSLEVKPFNDPYLFSIFFDKQLTHDILSAHSIPTVSINQASLQSIAQARDVLVKLMRSHPNSADFSSDIVLKDRFGAGGRHVYKFSVNQSIDMLTAIRRHPRLSFVIQPFVLFDRGFSFNHCPASTDIRFIYLKGKIIQVYIRVARPDDFRCNEHQGGLLTYLRLDDIPLFLVAKSNHIAGILNKKCSLFSLDFIISNNGNAYLLEGNTGPGLDWNMSLKKNEIEAKKLIRLIIRELIVRVKTQIDYSQLPQPQLTLTPLYPDRTELALYS